MSEKSAALEELRARIGNYLREIVRGYEVRRDGSYSIRTGTTRVVIKPLGLPGSDKTIVSIFALVAIDVNVTNELMRYLNEINQKINFGKFFVVEDKKLVICQHALLGSTLDKDELTVGIGAIAYSSDQHDEKIIKSFGGKRCIDAENEALRRFPPGYTGHTITS